MESCDKFNTALSQTILCHAFDAAQFVLQTFPIQAVHTIKMAVTHCSGSSISVKRVLQENYHKPLHCLEVHFDNCDESMKDTGKNIKRHPWLIWGYLGYCRIPDIPKYSHLLKKSGEALYLRGCLVGRLFGRSVATLC